ncbi:MAG: hypothetical protein ACJAZ1_002818 [Yoonia sp.]|jgi:hypothetical protein
MKKLAIIAALCASPVLADPLDLIDYAELFADNQDMVQVVSPARQILQLDNITVLHDTNEVQQYTGLDESGEGAVGCFVTILATIESALQACEATLSDDQAAVQASYLDEALSFYAANAVPPVSRATVQERFDALVASQIEGALPYCANLSVVTNLAEQIFSADSRAEIDGMMSVPRLPVSNPCL